VTGFVGDADGTARDIASEAADESGVIGFAVGIGVRGKDSGGGVLGESSSSAGVTGASELGPGVVGTSPTGIGVLGQSARGDGVTGTSDWRVRVQTLGQGPAREAPRRRCAHAAGQRGVRR